MNKQELIEALESMPDEALICMDCGFMNLIEVSSVKYDPSQNIIVVK